MTASLATQSFNLVCPASFYSPTLPSLKRVPSTLSGNLFFLPCSEARHPCPTSELADSAIGTMRPISMAQNDLLHGQPQFEHDNLLHVLRTCT